MLTKPGKPKYQDWLLSSCHINKGLLHSSHSIPFLWTSSYFSSDINNKTHVTDAIVLVRNRRHLPQLPHLYIFIFICMKLITGFMTLNSSVWTNIQLRRAYTTVIYGKTPKSGQNHKSFLYYFVSIWSWLTRHSVIHKTPALTIPTQILLAIWPVSRI